MKKIGICFGGYCPLHQGHLDVIMRAKKENDKCLDYDVIVAKDCELGAAKIARFIKDMIGKSNKFMINPSVKRRKYYVEEIKGKSLPIKANISFSRK